MKEKKRLFYVLTPACALLVCLLLVSAACGRENGTSLPETASTAPGTTAESGSTAAPMEGSDPAGQPTVPGNDPAVYQVKYPDMFVTRPAQHAPEGERLAYLTFDDGPSKYTEDILRVLDEKEVKATFFVVCKENDHAAEQYQAIIKRGHTLAIHTASHQYREIYQSVESYLDDFYRIWKYLYDLTGVPCTMFRFPGGSNNSFSVDIHDALEKEMLRRGFTYWDWNVDSNDTAKRPTKQSVVDHTLRTVNIKNRSVILMHDSGAKSYTVEALPDIIQELKNRGYQFDRLEDTMKPVTFDQN